MAGIAFFKQEIKNLIFLYKPFRMIYENQKVKAFLRDFKKSFIDLLDLVELKS